MTSSNKPLDLKGLLGRVLDFSPEKIQDSDSHASIPGWDSFQSLILFQELEEAGGASFAVEDLKGVKTVQDIKKLLDKYKIKYI